MKFQKTMLAASLALAAAGANASGEAPKSPDVVHHVISQATANVGNYAKVWFDNTTGEINLGTPGDFTTVTVSNIAPNATSRSVDALDYLYEQLKTYNGTTLQSATNANKLTELNDIYQALGGTSPNGVLDFFAQASGQTTGNNGAFLAQNFVTQAVPNLDIYADGFASAVNTYNATNQNIVSPVYGRDQVGLSLQGLSNLSGAPVAHGIDLNSRKAIIESDQASAKKYQLIKYGTGASAVYQLYNLDDDPVVDAPAFADYFTRDIAGNLVKTTVAADAPKGSISKGGQYTVTGTGSGEEIKLITDEHLTYGFKSTQQKTGTGQVTDVNAGVGGVTGLEKIGSVEGVTGKVETKYDYVNVGVVGNTLGDLDRLAGETDEAYAARNRAAHYANPDKSIYGVSAERTAENGVRNITTLTGYGLSLSNLGTAPEAKLNFDGSVTKPVSDAKTGAPLQTQYFADVNGEKIVKVANTKEKKTDYYVADTTTNKMVLVTDQAKIERLDAATKDLNATLTGVSRVVEGSANVTEHNVVTNKVTQYYTETESAGSTSVAAAVVDPNGQIPPQSFTTTASGGNKEVDVRSVQLGTIANDVYGVRVFSGTKGTTGNFSELTSTGLVTNGVVDAKTFKIDGKDVTEFLKTGVAPEPTDPTDPTPGTGTGGVTEAVVDTKVEAKAKVTLEAANAYTDTKVDGAIKTASVEMTKAASEAATTAATKVVDTKVEAASIETLKSANTYTDKAVSTVNSRVDQLNTRVDDVERTANRGVAIALAAQQAVPNIAPGQVAVFGGVGHYEGETAGSIGVVTSFTDRISASGAFGFAGGNEFGGRVGVSYVFGGK